MKKIFIIFIFFTVLVYSEELILKEMEGIPKELKLVDNYNYEVKKIVLLKNTDTEKYFLEFYYERNKKIFRNSIEISKTEFEILAKETESLLSWEKNIDTSFIVYTTTANIIAYTYYMTSDIEILNEAGKLSLISGAGLIAYLLSNSQSRKGYFLKRDFMGMQNFLFSTLFNIRSLAENFNTTIENKNKIAATSAMLAYFFSKKLIDSYELNIASTSLGLRLQLMNYIFFEYLYGAKKISFIQKSNLQFFGGVTTFFSGVVFGKKYNLSTGNMAICDNISDALIISTVMLANVEDPYRGIATYIAGNLPYIFAPKIEETLSFRENDNIGIKTAELVGMLLGAAIGEIFDANEKIRAVLVSTGIAGMTLYSANSISNRKNIKVETSKSMFENITINPVAILPLMKIPSKTELIRIEF